MTIPESRTPRRPPYLRAVQLMLAVCCVSACGDEGAGGPLPPPTATAGSGGQGGQGAAGTGGSAGSSGASGAGAGGSAGQASDCPTPNPQPLPGQRFVIESVRFDRNEVTVRNVSGQPQTLTPTWRWCDFPNYGLMTEEADRVVAAGEAVTVQTSEGARLANGGEMGLYTSDEYTEPSSLLAYVTWGSGTSGDGPSEREPVATQAGIWTFGERVRVGIIDAGFVATGPSNRADGFTTLPTRCVF